LERFDREVRTNPNLEIPEFIEPVVAIPQPETRPKDHGLSPVKERIRTFSCTN